MSEEMNFVPVLVSFRFLKFKWSPWREEALMLHAASSDDIVTFAERMIKPRRYYNYELTGYLPANGMREF